MSEFHLHLIEPRDPLIARDGRPFHADPGARATSLSFPFPSTTTGGLRTRWGQDSDGVFAKSPSDARQIEVRGPLLAELNNEGEVEEFLAPAPSDCLFVKQNPDDPKSPILRKRLVPARVPDGLRSDAAVVAALAAGEDAESKPQSGPAFWHWKEFEPWLAAPQDECEGALAELGHDGPAKDTRSHVKLSEASYGHEEGGLFGTRGLEFRRKEGDSTPHRLALVLWSRASRADVREGAGHLGGERRLMAWRVSAAKLPACPCTEAIMKAGACRVILLTPAFFEAGWRPHWLLEERYGVQPELLTACVGRAGVVSGWDFEARSAKPTRRLVPAGAVYFLKLHGEPDAIEKWVRAMWLAPVSDDPVARCDGFGLAALGVGEKEPREGLL